MGAIKFTACLLWAFAIGVSVAVQLCVSVALNSRSSSPTSHAPYVATLGVLLGGVFLVPSSVLSREPCHRPRHRWSVFGGALTVISFLSVPAGRALGVQLVLLVQLFGMLGTSIVLDLRSGKLQPTDKVRIGGFLLVIIGVFLGNVSEIQSGIEFSVASIIYLTGVFFAGIAFTVQAVCTDTLAQDVGGVPRATIINALVNACAMSPLILACLFYLGVRPVIHAADWPMWTFCGLQSALYIGSLAVIPRTLGFTNTYMALLTGKLSASSVVDSVGLSGTIVAFTWIRGLSMVVVVVGATLFSAKGEVRSVVRRNTPISVMCDELDATT